MAAIALEISASSSVVSLPYTQKGAKSKHRYSARKLVIADPALAAKRFGGSFPAGDVDTLVRQLQRNFRVTVEQRDGEWVLHAPE